jgi:hypothetical protein
MLNSDSSTEALRDVRPHVTLVAGLLSHPTPLPAPPEIERCLSRVIEYFRLLSLEPPRRLPGFRSQEGSQQLATNSNISYRWQGESFTCDAVPSSIQHNVKLNRQTTLTTLYIYEDVNAYVEYPETSATQPVGYLFRQDPHNWENPTHCFAYSLGKPSGQTRRGDEVGCLLLTTENGTKVPCVESHSTCTLVTLLKALSI